MLIWKGLRVAEDYCEDKEKLRGLVFFSFDANCRQFDSNKEQQRHDIDSIRNARSSTKKTSRVIWPGRGCETTRSTTWTNPRQGWENTIDTVSKLRSVSYFSDLPVSGWNHRWISTRETVVQDKVVWMNNSQCFVTWSEKFARHLIQLRLLHLQCRREWMEGRCQLTYVIILDHWWRSSASRWCIRVFSNTSRMTSAIDLRETYWNVFNERVEDAEIDLSVATIFFQIRLRSGEKQSSSCSFATFSSVRARRNKVHLNHALHPHRANRDWRGRYSLQSILSWPAHFRW